MNKIIVKKIIAVLLILVTAIAVCSAGCVENKPTIVVGIHGSMAPWEAVDEDNNPYGASVDIINLASEIEGFNVKYVVGNPGWEEGLENGTIDCVGTIIKTDERLEKYLFTKKPFEDTRFIAIASDDAKFTIDDVIAGNVRIAVLKGGSYETWVKGLFKDDCDERIADGRIYLTDNVNDLAMAINLKKVDAAVGGDVALSEQLNYFPTLKFIGYIGEPIGSGCVFRKDEADYVKMFNDAVDKMKDTPELDYIAKKYNLQYKKGTYIVGVDKHNEPWTYLDSDGEYKGYDIEQIKWIGEQQGFDVEFKEYTWDIILNAIIVGDIDMWASSMTITDERQNYVGFSNPYYSSGISVGVKPSSSLTIADLDKSDAKIITVSGTTYVDWLKDYLGKEKYNKKIADNSIILAFNAEEFYDLYNAGEADFCVLGTNQMKDDVNKGLSKIIYTEDNVEQFGIAFSNGNIVLQNMINEGLAAFDKSEKKAELLKKYEL